jgi:predicted nucleotide-binding protein (sugar kinase/HSP70/actin superfamily)
MLPALERSAGADRHPLTGKKVYIAPMAEGSARAFAAAFRALGIDADITPPSDQRTLELGGRHISGDECYPARVTVGDAMKVLEAPGVDPARVAFFMPTATGPCRFGQYAPFLRQALDESGYRDTQVLAPTSSDGYASVGAVADQLFRSGWRALVAADAVRKLQLMYRPFELEAGSADRAHEESIADLCAAIEGASVRPAPQLEAVRAAVTRARDRFRAIPARRDRSAPLIGVVGEIFCRLNDFSNEQVVRRLERQGAETWLSDVAEWIWYTNKDRIRKLRLHGRGLTLEHLGVRIRNAVQARDEHRILEPLREDFRGLEEPEIGPLLEGGRPYLPQAGAFGEMVVSVGKIVYLAGKGVDGIVDISPFSCMNGIVCEAVYPRLSRDLGGLPIRNFYFDGTQSDLDRDLGVFLELAHAHQQRKAVQRVFPPYPA